MKKNKKLTDKELEEKYKDVDFIIHGQDDNGNSIKIIGRKGSGQDIVEPSYETVKEEEAKLKEIEDVREQASDKDHNMEIEDIDF